jgi:hypothetical protein
LNIIRALDRRPSTVRYDARASGWKRIARCDACHTSDRPAHAVRLTGLVCHRLQEGIVRSCCSTLLPSHYVFSKGFLSYEAIASPHLTAMVTDQLRELWESQRLEIMIDWAL